MPKNWGLLAYLERAYSKRKSKKSGSNVGDKKTWWTELEEGQAWEDSYYMASEKLTETFYSLWLSPAFTGMTHCSQLNSWLKLRKGFSPFAVWIHVCNFCDPSIQGKNCFRFFPISCIISELRSHFVETVGTNFNKQKNKNRRACTASLISKPERMGLHENNLSEQQWIDLL